MTYNDLPPGIIADFAAGAEGTPQIIILTSHEAIDGAAVVAMLGECFADSAGGVHIRDGGPALDWEAGDAASVADTTARVLLLVRCGCPPARIHRLLRHCHGIFGGAEIFVHHMA